MAWANFLCSEKQGTFNDLSSVGTNYTQLYNNLSDAQADFNSKVSGGTPIVKNETLVGDTTTGVIIDSNPYLIVRLNGNYVTEATGGRAPSGNTQSIFIAVIDSDNQYGNIGWVTLWNPDSSRFYVSVNWSTNPTTLQKQQMYTVITSNPIITYTWSSVPAISGKNGILSLTTLKEESINDGSPVDDATASAFNNAPNSCSVGGIVSVDLPIIDDNPLTIAVKYNIPELTDSVYSSCKVVAKKNKIPKSKTDGDKILDVSPSSHGCVIKGLEQETKYYVVVFVEDSFGNKAESEPGGPVRTGKQSGIFKIRITTSQGVKDNDFKEVIEVTRV